MFWKLRNGIRNLIRWFPIIWNDGDWDYHFLLRVLRFKLQDLQGGISSRNRHVGCQRQMQRIDLCIKLLNRLLADNYHELAFASHDRKWGKPEFSWKAMPNNDMEELEMHRAAVITEKDENQQRKEYRRWAEHWRQLERQDIEMLFSTMAKYIQYWWD